MGVFYQYVIPDWINNSITINCPVRGKILVKKIYKEKSCVPQVHHIQRTGEFVILVLR